MSAKSKRKNPRLSIHGPTPAERKWTRIVEKWSQSGLPGTEFCRKRGHSIAAFTFWKKEIRVRQGRRKSQEEKPSQKKRPPWWGLSEQAEVYLMQLGSGL